MDVGEQKALADIAAYGCHVIHVFEEGEAPPWTYSVGVHKTSGAPEVIVIGLKRALAHSVVNEYNDRVRSDERFAPGRRYEGFIEAFRVQFEVVAPRHFAWYLGWDRWLYGGDNFEVLQLIYPTTDGVWPWEEAASASFRTWQPILNEHGRPDTATEARRRSMPPYTERFPVGSAVRIAVRERLEEFRRTWHFHHPLDTELLRFAGQRALVRKVGFYHGGDVLYELADVPGIWHEECLEALPARAHELPPE